jgi:hypothetical protein
MKMWSPICEDTSKKTEKIPEEQPQREKKNIEREEVLSARTVWDVVDLMLSEEDSEIGDAPGELDRHLLHWLNSPSTAPHRWERWQLGFMASLSAEIVKIYKAKCFIKLIKENGYYIAIDDLYFPNMEVGETIVIDDELAKNYSKRCAGAELERNGMHR